MNLKNKRVLVVSTTDDMIGNFMIPHILHMQQLGAEVECACNCHSHHAQRIAELTGCGPSQRIATESTLIKVVSYIVILIDAVSVVLRWVMSKRSSDLLSVE